MRIKMIRKYQTRAGPSRAFPGDHARRRLPRRTSDAGRRGQEKYLKVLAQGEGFDQVAFGNLNELRARSRRDRRHPGQPVQARGIRPARRRVSTAVARSRRRVGLLLMFDEVQWASRTGKLFL